MELSKALEEAADAAGDLRQMLSEWEERYTVKELPWFIPVLRDAERLHALVCEARLQLRHGIFISERDIKQLQGRLNHG